MSTLCRAVSGHSGFLEGLLEINIFERLDEAYCTLLAEIDGESLDRYCKSKGLLSVGAVSIYLLDWAHIQ